MSPGEVATRLKYAKGYPLTVVCMGFSGHKLFGRGRVPVIGRLYFCDCPVSLSLCSESLTYLQLVNTQWTSIIGIFDILQSCPNLQEFDLMNVDVIPTAPAHPPVIHLDEMKSLVMDHLSKETILTLFPKLDIPRCVKYFFTLDPILLKYIWPFVVPRLQAALSAPATRLELTSSTNHACLTAQQSPFKLHFKASDQSDDMFAELGRRPNLEFLFSSKQSIDTLDNPTTLSLIATPKPKSPERGWDVPELEELKSVDILKIGQSIAKSMVAGLVSRLSEPRTTGGGGVRWLWPRLETITLDGCIGYTPKAFLAMIRARPEYAQAHPSLLARIGSVTIGKDSPMNKKTFKELEKLIGVGQVHWSGCS